MSRPDENVDWAEGTGAQVSEPANERAGGFPFRYVPPAEQINWMWRAVGRWVRWLRDKSDNHVHDGEGGDLSAPKVELAEHIEYGTYGKLTVEKDTESEHVIRHTRENGGMQTTFRTGRVHASEAFLEKITMPLLGGVSTLRIAKLTPGDPPVILVVEGEVRTDVISSDNLVVSKLFGGPGHGEITANNTAKAWGVIDRTITAVPNGDCFLDGVGIESIERPYNNGDPTVGWWIVHLSEPITEYQKAAVLISTSNPAFTGYEWIDASTVEVQTREPDSPTALKDVNFSIQILHANH